MRLESKNQKEKILNSEKKTNESKGTMNIKLVKKIEYLAKEKLIFEKTSFSRRLNRIEDEITHQTQLIVKLLPLETSIKNQLKMKNLKILLTIGTKTFLILSLKLVLMLQLIRQTERSGLKKTIVHSLMQGLEELLMLIMLILFDLPN